MGATTWRGVGVWRYVDRSLSRVTGSTGGTGEPKVGLDVLSWDRVWIRGVLRGIALKYDPGPEVSFLGPNY